jgi:exonuclease VII large subunit
VHLSAARVASFERELIAVDPREVLRRGYSYTTDARGELIRSVREVSRGDQMRTHLSDGTIDSVVGGARTRRRRDRSAANAAEQMDLFE